MMNLELIITKYTKVEEHEQNWLKTQIHQTFGKIVVWNVLSFQKAGASNSKPNPRETAFKVRCRTLFAAQNKKDHPLCEIYRSQINEWMKKMEYCSASIKPLPWLSVDSCDAYPKIYAATHEDVSVSEFALGTLARPTEFFQNFSAPSTKEFPISASFFHDTKELHITLDAAFQFQVRYQSIRNIIVSEKDFWLDIYFYISCPPKLTTTAQATTKGRQTAFSRGRWQRAAEIPFKNYCSDKLGRSNMIHVRLTKTPQCSSIISRLFYKCGNMPIVFVPIRKVDVTHLLFEVNVDLGSFNCTYMFNGLLWRSFVILLQNLQTHTLARLMNHLCKENSKILYLALIDIMHFLDEGLFFDFQETVCQLFCWYQNNHNACLFREDFYIQPEKTQRIFRITITPTRWVLWPADVVKENRVLRKFNPDYACRVSFRDEDLSRLNSQAGFCAYNFYEHIIQIPMKNGIAIGSRRYEFLGWSNSQIRDHGLWLYAKDDANQTSASIREWMGNFSHIRSVPKFMARMGQCFSQTEESVKVPLESSHVRVEEDIKGGLNPVSKDTYCFSDGVGSISVPLSKKVYQKLGLKHSPSAFQMRYAGFKGMLVTNPKLQDVDIVFRKSMEKFPCKGSNYLEICKTSKIVPVFLNRQFIAILDHMGVASSVFLKLQEDMLRTLTDMLLYNKKAAEYLSHNCPLLDLDFGGLTVVGIGLNVEPFFRSMLLALHCKAVEGIRCKARLAIDSALGRNMFGVLDETATLKYGQVFIQYTTREGQADTSICCGRVLVTKNPCLQPGDVRILEAVNVTALHHIVNCIVFPQDGPRPHANEMAGSDLDGDEFTIIWDENLLFEGPNAAPSHFPIPEEKLKEGPIGIDDMIEFLCGYIQNDQVGVIGNSHLARADELGLNHPLCSAIAQKFSLAVDFVKNGQLITLDEEERPKIYPDFMNKGCQAKSYRSRKSVGKLFRVCKDFEMQKDGLSLKYDKVQLDTELEYPGWKPYREKAQESLQRYNRLMEGLLQQYGLAHEVEATARAFLNIHGRLQGREDRSDAEEMVVLSIQTLWKNMKKEFYWEFNNHRGDGDNEGDFKEYNLQRLDPSMDKMLQKASAWYMVTYSNPHSTFLSFPWIVSKLLVLVKLKNRQRNNVSNLPCSDPFVARMQKLLTSFLDLQNRTNQEIALLVLEKWAQHHELLLRKDAEIQNHSSPSLSQPQSKTLPFEALVEIFLEVNGSHLEKSTPIEMILRFLSRAISLRFISKAKLELYSCKVKAASALGKAAMFTYHSLAVSGSLSALGFSAVAVDSGEIEEMNAVRLESDLLYQHKRNDYKCLKEQLQKLSGVSEISVRSRFRHVLVGATGTSKAIKSLEKLLGKDPDEWLSPLPTPGKGHHNTREFSRREQPLPNCKGRHKGREFTRKKH